MSAFFELVPSKITVSPATGSVLADQLSGSFHSVLGPPPSHVRVAALTVGGRATLPNTANVRSRGRANGASQSMARRKRELFATR